MKVSELKKNTKLYSAHSGSVTNCMGRTVQNNIKFDFKKVLEILNFNEKSRKLDAKNPNHIPRTRQKCIKNESDNAQIWMAKIPMTLVERVKIVSKSVSDPPKSLKIVQKSETPKNITRQKYIKI